MSSPTPLSSDQLAALAARAAPPGRLERIIIIGMGAATLTLAGILLWVLTWAG